MARKSRKNPPVVTTDSKEEPLYLMTAIYARLSLENSGKNDDGNSIANQITFCQNFLQEHPELKLYDIYLDNGKTGTDFNRPDFQRLMQDVKCEKVKCIVVKDLSRFGRNYIETGEYLETIFPFMGVRFIAITDGFDSAASTNMEKLLMVPLKNMMNESYAKDISKKIRSVFQQQKEMETFLPSSIPYGYVKSKTKPYHYEVDEKTAPYVKMIFEWKAQGMSIRDIRRKLNEIGAITPTQRKFELGHLKNKNSVITQWAVSCYSITNILRNSTYTGCLIYGKSERLNSGHKYHEKPPEEWILVPNKHEAIISQELFNDVQVMLNQTKLIANERRELYKESRIKLINLFKDKVYCADCEKKMFFLKRKDRKTQKHTYYRSFFECANYFSNKMCTKHTIHYITLYNSVLDIIKYQKQLFLEKKENLKVSLDDNNTNLGLYKEEYNRIKQELDNVNTKRNQLFEDFVMNTLEKSEYISSKKCYDELAKNLKTQLEQIDIKTEAVKNEMHDSNFEKKLEDLGNLEELNQEIIDTLIKKIIVFENKAIQIEWNFDITINV